MAHIYFKSMLLISSFQMKKKIAVNKLCQSRIVAFVIQNGCLKASILYQKFLFDFILSCLRLPLYSNSSFETKKKIDWIYLLQVSPICVCYFRYGRWVTRRVAVLSIVTIWLLAALVSFVPISFGLHRYYI